MYFQVLSTLGVLRYLKVLLHPILMHLIPLLGLIDPNSLETSSVGTPIQWHCTQETDTHVESHLPRGPQRGHFRLVSLHAGDRHLR